MSDWLSFGVAGLVVLMMLLAAAVLTVGIIGRIMGRKYPCNGVFFQPDQCLASHCQRI